ncbi:hypothetical protein [Streptomyces wuyuanensis]|uniref:hypothetical protein n=1 Tax=Streptomyces wuyuanensis TaxID=1196353 RepID=UPI00371CD053
MPPTPTTPPDRGEPRIRDRGDACPGALRLHPADDGRLARLRLPAGKLTGDQTQALTVAAGRLGDGALSITSRGNAELRGLADGCGAELAEVLRDAGLLPSETHERVRNIVASPLAGLDGLGRADVQLWASELDALLCASGPAAALSGRFLFALDDGRGDVAGLGADVTLLAEAEGRAVLRIGRRTHRVRAADAARAALAAAEAFLAAAAEAGTGAWRVRELPDGQDIAVDAWLERAGVVPAPPAPADRTERSAPDQRPGPPPEGPAGPAAGPLPGIVAGPDGWAVSVAATLGRLTVDQLRELLPAPADEVRLTPWRGVVLPGFADRGTAEARLRALARAGLVTGTDSPWYGVGACTGRPGCAKSLADVRADVRADVAPGRGGLPVYWSGCERRCGRPRGDYVDVVATGDGGYRVTAHGVPVPVTSRAALADTIATARTRTTK